MGNTIERQPRSDLIETLWNVKAFANQFINALVNRFNRDIVECKDGLPGIPVTSGGRFNRDIVECKGDGGGADENQRN